MADKELPLWDRPTEEYGHIETNGSTLKPWLSCIGYMVDEARFEFTNNGIQVKMVDPANVMMLDTTIHQPAFMDYDVDATIGANVGSFRHIVRRARVSSDDRLLIDVNDNQIVAEVSRGYEDANIISCDTTAVLDPDSIRKEPDMPGFERDYEITMSTEAFSDVVDHVSTGDHITVGSNNGILEVSNSVGTSVLVDGVEVDCEDTIFSRDYIETISRMLKKSRADEVTLSWTDEYPITARFERTRDDEVITEYEVLVAPRIRND